MVSTCLKGALYINKELDFITKSNNPLLIGVTGHRDLFEKDVPRLKEVVKVEVFNKIREINKDSTIFLLSPLAEGADRLVAEVALEEQVELIVPLPMPLEEYQKDFRTNESQSNFLELLAKAESWFQLPLQDQMIAQQEFNRKKQYEFVSAYIVNHSKILIALWDGRFSKKIGGTAQTVKFMLDGIPKDCIIETTQRQENKDKLVYHIITPRKKNPTPAGEPFSLRLLKREEQ